MQYKVFRLAAFLRAVPQWLTKLDTDQNAVVIWCDFTKLGTITAPELAHMVATVKTAWEKRYTVNADPLCFWLSSFTDGEQNQRNVIVP